jgi:DNA-binding transcriptional MerR regulator
MTATYTVKPGGRPREDKDMNAAAEMHMVATTPETSYTIGDLAREYDVTLRALRFYEARGMLRPRRSGLTRLYSESDRKRLGLILKGKQMGFTLQEIRAMLASEGNNSQPSELKLTKTQIDEQLEVLVRQRADLDTAISELKAKRERL